MKYDLIKKLLTATIAAVLIFTIAKIHRGAWVINPVLNFGPIELHLYSAIILLAVIMLIFLVKKIVDKDKKLKKINYENLIFTVLIFGVTGARIWHLVTDWQLYSDDLISALFIWNGGLGIVGGVLGGALGIWIYSKIENFNFFKLANVIALFLPLAQIIGRYGNLFNQEIFGKPTNFPWGLFIRPENRPQEYLNSSYFHPAYLYEQLGNLLLLGVNYLIYKKLKLRGNLFIGTWLLGYGTIRFFVEFFRIDDKYYAGFSINQIFALLLVVSGIIYLVIKIKQIKNE